ncbi:MAG: serine protease [Pseudomonadota bacterium]
MKTITLKTRVFAACTALLGLTACNVDDTQTDTLANTQSLESSNIVTPSTSEFTGSAELGQRILDAYDNGVAFPVIAETKIINGVNADEGEYPWMVRTISLDAQNLELLRNGEGFSFGACGGSLIEADWVLTAAHCLQTPNLAAILVFVGSRDTDFTLNSGGGLTARNATIFSAQRFVNHPNYDDRTLTNDVALVQLIQNVPANLVPRLMQIPTVQDTDRFAAPADPFTGQQADVLRAIGWGNTIGGTSSGSDILQETGLTVISERACQSVFGTGIDYAGQICAQANNSNICQGDSGGPLFFRTNGQDFIAGITSFSPRGCTVNVPSGFTRVTSFANWIDGVVATF